MFKSRVVSTLLSFSILCLFASVSHALRGYYLQASLGETQQRTIQTLRSDLTLDNAWTASGELGMFVIDNVALGLQFGFQNNDAADYEIDWFGSDRPGVYAVGKIRRWKIDTNLYELKLRSSVWIPRQSGLMLGVGAGVGHFSSNTGVSSPIRSANAPVFELFAGLQHTFANEFMLFCRLGYAHRDFGTVDANFGHMSIDPIDLDLSGWFLEIGLGGNTRRGWSSAK